MLWFCLFKQKTAYDLRISDGSSDVCSSDLAGSPWPVPDMWRLPPHAHTHSHAGRGPEWLQQKLVRMPDPVATIDLYRQRRPEERRVGKEWLHTCRSRWSTHH